jgi:hypothetical protein
MLHFKKEYAKQENNSGQDQGIVKQFKCVKMNSWRDLGNLYWERKLRGRMEIVFKYLKCCMAIH